MLAPDTGETVIQFTDVVSLCGFMSHCAENRITEVFNVLSQRGAYSLQDYLEECKAVTGSDARFTWVPRDFLETQDVKPYRDLPMWRPEPVGFYTFSAEKALKAGFDLLRGWSFLGARLVEALLPGFAYEPFALKAAAAGNSLDDTYVAGVAGILKDILPFSMAKGARSPNRDCERRRILV